MDDLTLNDQSTGVDSSQSTGADKDFVEYIVKSIVSQPEKVMVARSVDSMGVLLTLQVSKEDMGKVIGKSGQTAKSIRILLRVLGSMNNVRINLKIVEPEGGEVNMGALDDEDSMGSSSIMDEPDLEL
ncbi:KH domain-containing protein [Candidatus Peregrinibacteria bacterium]|nr:MAG: KH domain-containing protein [Candidatus Peregrinibacteria bacterium]